MPCYHLNWMIFLMCVAQQVKIAPVSSRLLVWIPWLAVISLLGPWEKPLDPSCSRDCLLLLSQKSTNMDNSVQNKSGQCFCIQIRPLGPHLFLNPDTYGINRAPNCYSLDWNVSRIVIVSEMQMLYIHLLLSSHLRQCCWFPEFSRLHSCDNILKCCIAFTFWFVLQ